MPVLPCQVCGGSGGRESEIPGHWWACGGCDGTGTTEIKPPVEGSQELVDTVWGVFPVGE